MEDAREEQKAAQRDFCILVGKENPDCLENLDGLRGHNSSL